MTFSDRLDQAIAQKGSPALVGLDPFLDRIPTEFAAVHDPGASRAEQAASMGTFSVQ